AALLVDHQVNAIAAMAALQPLLRFDEILVVTLPVATPAALADLPEVLLLVLAKALQQFILQRQEELTAPRVALAAGAAGQLAVDSDVLVALRAQPLPSARLDALARRLDVGAATGHVGRDGDSSLLPGLGHDLCFLLMLPGVENLMLDVGFFQT